MARDVAEWIDYAYKDSRKINRDVSKMLSMVDDEEKCKNTIKLGGEDYSHGGIRENTEIWFLTEDGLYEVLMQSHKPIAKQFKKKFNLLLYDYTSVITSHIIVSAPQEINPMGLVRPVGDMPHHMSLFCSD